jgi:hypothetical protein
LFIGALSPRAILSGKVAAALILAVLIFSACAPFMAFTYFLRGIDLATIFFVLGLDFLVVMVMVMLALFLAIVPANRLFKVLLGLVGLFFGLVVYVYTLAGSYTLLAGGMMPSLDSPDFQVVCLVLLLETLGVGLFLFVCSVGLLSPLSANRSLPLRVGVTLFWLGSGVLLTGCATWIDSDWPILVWIWSMSSVLCLCLLIAVNEREQWAPRVARTIPRRWWLRPLAFLFFSGAAGGVVWACLLYAGCWLALPLLRAGWLPTIPRAAVADNVWTTLMLTTVMIAYAYCYALTAVFVRLTLIKIQPVYTWLVALALIALGSSLPYLATFLIHYRDWAFSTHYLQVLTNPGAGMRLVSEPELRAEGVALAYVSCWAAIVTVLNGPWFIRQIRRFRPSPAVAASL